MGLRFIGLIKRWEINNEPPPRVEPLYVHVPVEVLWGDPNAFPSVSLPSRANGDKSVLLMQRTNTLTADRMMMPRYPRRYNAAEYNVECRSDEGAAAGVPPGLQTLRSRSHSPLAELHSSTTKKKTNQPVVLRRSKIPHGRSDLGGTSGTKTRSHARLLPSTSPNSRDLRRPRQAPRDRRRPLHERRAWPICHR